MPKSKLRVTGREKSTNDVKERRQTGLGGFFKPKRKPGRPKKNAVSKPTSTAQLKPPPPPADPKKRRGSYNNYKKDPAASAALEEAAKLYNQNLAAGDGDKKEVKEIAAAAVDSAVSSAPLLSIPPATIRHRAKQLREEAAAKPAANDSNKLLFRVEIRLGFSKEK